MVGLDQPDDAGVFRLDAQTALVQTIDFFTPVVDDPRTFGRIAAANALSDLYAMGVRPITALNLIGFPKDKLPLAVLAEILAGGAETVAEAGAVVIGGHSIDDAEPKYGLAMTGLIEPSKVITKRGAQPGDLLILTKPLGIGIITTALKRGLAAEETVVEAIRWMSRLNRGAAEAMLEIGVHACTDVTGFGLLGHALEVAQASEVALRVWADQVPCIQSTTDLAAQNVVPGGSWANLRYLQEKGVHFGPRLPPHMPIILADAITSGGLLMAVAPNKKDALLAALEIRGELGAVVGEAAALTVGEAIMEIV